MADVTVIYVLPLHPLIPFPTNDIKWGEVRGIVDYCCSLYVENRHCCPFLALRWNLLPTVVTWTSRDDKQSTRNGKFAWSYVLMYSFNHKVVTSIKFPLPLTQVSFTIEQMTEKRISTVIRVAGDFTNTFVYLGSVVATSLIRGVFWASLW